MENITPEMIEKAKEAKTPEELLEMANKAGLGLEIEDAKAYFDMLNPKTGELDDDDLDNVSGGACKSKKSGRTVVTNQCKCFTGKWMSNIKGYGTHYVNIGVRGKVYYKTDHETLRAIWAEGVGYYRCGACRYLEFEGGTGVCELT